jgi:hypothetical protein
MQRETVLDIMRDGFEKALELVDSKGKDYHHHEDRLSHLKATAQATGTTPLRSTHNLVAKHFTALPDMFDSKEQYSLEKYDDYLIDILVYVSYLRCLLREE